MAKYDPRTYKYLVTDNDTGKKYKSASLDKAAKISKMDKYDITSSSEDRGGADTDRHNVKVQSYGKGFAFR